MPPKWHGPMSENTAKHPREQGPIQYKHRHIQAMEAPNLCTSSGSSQLIEVPSGNTGTTVERDNQDVALSAITKLRNEGYASAVGSGPHHKQYSKVGRYSWA